MSNAFFCCLSKPSSLSRSYIAYMAIFKPMVREWMDVWRCVLIVEYCNEWLRQQQSKVKRFAMIESDRGESSLAASGMAHDS